MRRFWLGWLVLLGLVLSGPLSANYYWYNLSNGSNCGSVPCNAQGPEWYPAPTYPSGCWEWGNPEGIYKNPASSCGGMYAVNKVTRCSGSTPIADSDSYWASCVAACPSGQVVVNRSKDASGRSLTSTSQYCAAACPSGQVYNDRGVCVAPPCPTGSLAQFSCVSAGTTACVGGCSYSVAVGTQTSTGFFGSGQSSGATCSSGGCTALTQAEKDAICTGGEAPLLLRQVVCTLSGQPCPDGQMPTEAGCATPLPEGCVELEGVTVCASADQNCVVVNGERVCAEVPESELDREGCFWSLATGEWICESDTAKTTTGSTTTSVTDPVTGQTTTTTVTTTYNNVTGGTTTTTTTVLKDADGNEISRDSVEETKGLGGEGGSLLARGASVPGDKAALDWIRTEEEVKGEFFQRWDEAPIVAAVNGFYEMSITEGSGSCPELCLPLFNETLCTQVHCDLWDEIGDVLSTVFLAMWALLAIRIVLSA